MRWLAQGMILAVKAYRLEETMGRPVLYVASGMIAVMMGGSAPANAIPAFGSAVKAAVPQTTLEVRHRGGAAAAGLALGLLGGAMIASQGYYYYPSPYYYPPYPYYGPYDGPYYGPYYPVYPRYYRHYRRHR